MGIFSSKCEKCGGKIKKAAKFCSGCGTPEPGAWRKCPGCKSWVGADSAFCWKCKHDLQPAGREDFQQGIWSRPEGVFAAAYEFGNLRDLLTDKSLIQIKEGSQAVLMDAGKVTKVLEPGGYNLEGAGRALNHFGSPPPRSVVLVDASEIALPLRIEHLRSAEEMEVTFYGEVVMNFDPRRSTEFVKNLLAGKDQVTLDDLQDLVEPEIRMAVENLCNTSTIEDLVKDPDRRLRLEDEMNEVLEATLKANGLKKVRVATGDFAGAAYEEIREKSGEAEALRRKYEVDQRLREIMNEENLSEVSSEAQLARNQDHLTGELEAIAQGRFLQQEDYAQERELVALANRDEISRTEVSHRMAASQKQLEHEINLEITYDRSQRDKALADAELEVGLARKEVEKDEVLLGKDKVQLEKDRIHRTSASEQVEDEVEEARKWSRLKAENKDHDQKRELEALKVKAEVLKGSNIQELMALMEDQGQRDDMLKLHDQIAKSGMTMEELMQKTVQDSEEAKNAVREINDMNREQYQEMFKDLKGLNDENADRLERIMNSALETVAKVAAPRSGGKRRD